MPKYCHAGLIMPLLIGVMGCTKALEFELEQAPEPIRICHLSDSISLAQRSTGEFSLADNRLFQVFRGTGLLVEYSHEGRVVQVVDAWQGGLQAGNIVSVIPSEVGLELVEVQSSQLLHYPLGGTPFASPLGDPAQFHAYWFSHGGIQEESGVWAHLLKVGTHPFQPTFYAQNHAFAFVGLDGKVAKEIGTYPTEFQQGAVLAGHSGCSLVKLSNGNYCIGFDGSGEVQYWTKAGQEKGRLRLPEPPNYQIAPLSEAFDTAESLRKHSWVWGTLALDPTGKRVIRLLQGPYSDPRGGRTPSYLYAWDWEQGTISIQEIQGNTVQLAGFLPDGRIVLLQKDNARLILSAFSG